MKRKVKINLKYRTAYAYECEEDSGYIPNHEKRRDDVLNIFMSQSPLSSTNINNDIALCFKSDDQDLKYVLDTLRDKSYIKTDKEGLVDLSRYYYMIFKRTDIDEFNSVLDIIIVLKDGFLAALSYNVSGGFTELLRQVVSYLYENDLSSTEFVGYYMRIALNSSISNNSLVKKFLLGD